MKYKWTTFIDTTDTNGNGMVVDYDCENKMFRVSCFESYHFKDQVIFPKDIVKNCEYFI